MSRTSTLSPRPQWNFAAMWLLGLNGLVCLTLNVARGRFKRKFFPLTVSGIWRDLRWARMPWRRTA